MHKDGNAVTMGEKGAEEKVKVEDEDGVEQVDSGIVFKLLWVGVVLVIVVVVVVAIFASLVIY